MDSQSPAALVRSWYERLPKPIRTRATVRIPIQERDLIVSLLKEEVTELEEALNDNSVLRAADAIADIVYVAYGAALQFGFDLDLVLQDVHRANMSKCFADGHFEFDADGKVTRGNNYEPPDLTRVMDVDDESDH